MDKPAIRMITNMKDYIDKLKHFFQVQLWQETTESASKLKRLTRHAGRVVYVMARQLSTGELNLRAMSLVFTTLLSLVPLIAVAFSVLKAFGVHNQIEPVLLNFMAPLGEKAGEMTSSIIGFVENVKVGVLGSIGLGMLFYTIIALVQKVESAFNFVWRVKRSRSFARRFTDYMSVVMIGPVLVFSALGIAATVMDNDVVSTLQSIEPFGTLLLILSKLLPYFMIVLAFTFLYTFIPNTKVKLGPALGGAMVAGALWIGLGTLFATFVASSSNYTAIYSSFAILFFFMIWLYLGWYILLTGSQVAFYLQHPRFVLMGGKTLVLSPRLREKKGLWLMTIIARRFCEKKPAYSLSELEKLTTLSSENLEELLDILEEGGFIVEVAGDKDSFTMAGDVSKILVSEILFCLRSAEEVGISTLQQHTEPSIEAFFSEINEAQNTVLDDLSLRDLAIGKNTA
jgi:membrane protein